MDHHKHREGMTNTNPAIGWCFTLNNPGKGWNDDPKDWEARSAKGKQINYISWQKEKGEDGTHHYQGYVEFHKPKRLSGCRKINGRAHWEIRQGTQAQAIAYTQKADTRIDGPWEFGEAGPGQGARSDLDAIGHEIISGTPINEIATQNPGLFMQYGRGMRDLAMTTAGKYDHDDVRGVWYWGGPGTGKSRKARQEYPEAYLKAQNKWFDGYAGEHEVILDDLDKLGGDKLGHYLKIWADRYACTAEIKGATVNLQHRVFVVTSNYHPDTMWPEDEEMLLAIKRRFKIVHFANLPTNKKRKREDAFEAMDSYVGAAAMAIDGHACPFGCADTEACMCVQSGRVERQL